MGSKTYVVSSQEHFLLLWENRRGACCSEVLLTDVGDPVFHYVHSNGNDSLFCSIKSTFKCFFSRYLSQTSYQNVLLLQPQQICICCQFPWVTKLSLYSSNTFFFSEQGLTATDLIPKPPTSFLLMRLVCSTAMENQLLLQHPRATSPSFQPTSYLLRAIEKKENKS